MAENLPVASSDFLPKRNTETEICKEHSAVALKIGLMTKR
jgi:hypothetical protein